MLLLRNQLGSVLSSSDLGHFQISLKVPPTRRDIQALCRACGAQASMEEKWEVTFHRAGGSSLEFPIALRTSCEPVMIMKVNHQARQWPILSQSWAHMLYNWRMGGPTTECSTSLPSVKSNGKSSQRKNLTGCYFHRAKKNSVTTKQVP